MVRSLRYSIFVALAILLALCCSAVSVWGFAYDNPAEAAFSQTRFELVLPYVSFRGHNNLFTVDHLNLDLDQPSVKNQLLARLDGDDFKADLAAELKTGLTIGRFSLQLRPFVAGSTRMNYGIPKLMLVEIEEATGYYDLAGSNLNVLAGASLDFTYGHPFTLANDAQLGVGFTLRYVQGYNMSKAEITKGTIYFNEDELEKTTVDLAYRLVTTEHAANGELSIAQLTENLFQEPSGSGILADIGVVYNYDRLRAGLVLKNIGTIKWTNLRQSSYYRYEEINEDDFDLGFVEEHTEASLSEYTLSLPLVLQAHGSYRLVGDLYWHLGMEKGFADGWGISSKPYYQTGLEWDPSHLLRLAGNLSYHDGILGYGGLVELRLFFFWLNLQLGWSGEGDGVYAAAMAALHF